LSTFLFPSIGLSLIIDRDCDTLAMMASFFPKFKREAGIVCSYFIVSLLILFPLLPHLFSQIAFAANGDLRLSLAVLFSNLKKITQGDMVNLFQLPIIFPLSHVLTAGVNLFGQTLLLLPFYLVHIRNVYFLYNFLTFFAYVAAGYCAYLFVREWVSERWIAWIIGALYILLPYRVHNIPQLNLMFNFPIPLTMLFFSRYLKHGRLRELILFFLSFLAQIAFDLSIGLFLGIALAFFFLVYQWIFGITPRRQLWHLVAGSVLFVAIATLVFFPYLSSKTSFSIFDDSKAIPDFAFHSPVSFFSNWSYLLLRIDGVVWQRPPFSPGVSIFFFFIIAFAPFLESRLHKVLAVISLALLAAPALAMPFVHNHLPFAALNRICGWSLLLFLCCFTLILFMVRRRIQRPLLLLSLTWIFLQFFSSQISLPIFNVFQGMARFSSILLRARFIRTEYILLLLFFTISAFGFAHFFARVKKKKIWLALVFALVFAERFRWPVYPSKLKDDREGIRELYRMTASFPDHFGLLELPFDPVEPNHYSFFTIFHDKHTCHGHVSYLKDHYRLSLDRRILPQGGFSGLGDPEFIRSLKAKGVRLILLFNNRGSNEQRRDWFTMQKQVHLGLSRRLYEKIESNRDGVLLVLDEREPGPEIRYFLPHYALRGKKSLVCSVQASEETNAAFLFNGVLQKTVTLPAGSVSSVHFDLGKKFIALQFNYLQIRSGPGFELIRVRLN
jgi:hypothetical protein